MSEKGLAMSRLKNMSRAAWLVTGIVVALLLVPTGVAAKGLKIAGIITGPSGNRAEVTAANQLQVAEASPSSFYENQVLTSGGSYSALATPPAGHSLIIKTIHIAFGGVTPGTSFFGAVVDASNCSGAQVGIIDIVDFATTSGETQLSYDPGFTVPSGDVLCAISASGGGAQASDFGYSVPAAAAPSFAAPRG